MKTPSPFAYTAFWPALGWIVRLAKENAFYPGAARGGSAFYAWVGAGLAGWAHCAAKVRSGWGAGPRRRSI
jgi:hypothetical protein